MTRLLVIANARMPNEKAHGYQTAQMCEAFALTGASVRLVVPRRVNTSELRGVTDAAAYYGLRDNFQIVRLPCLDLLWVSGSKFAFLLQTATFILALMAWLPFQKKDAVFTRDHFVMAALTRIAPRRKLIYEVHSKFRSRRGARLQSWILRRVGKVVSLTGTMARQLEDVGARDVIVAHDGVRPERFADMPSTAEIRAEIGIPDDAFVACYAGRLHTMGMSKGLDVFVEAAAQVDGITFLLVGGPAEHVDELRARWLTLGLSAEDFVAVGAVAPAEVPRFLAAADACLITSPRNEFFANETSPMKLFEYMMAGRAIIASDLPSTREVVTDGQSALLVPPSDVTALAEALRRLRDDADLRRKLGAQAAQDVLQYTWQARAERILHG